MQKKSVKPDIETLASLPVRVDYLLLKDCFSNFKSPKKKFLTLKEKDTYDKLSVVSTSI